MVLVFVSDGRSCVMCGVGGNEVSVVAVNRAWRSIELWGADPGQALPPGWREAPELAPSAAEWSELCAADSSALH